MTYAADLSSFNAPAASINWQQYKAWSAQGDGISRLIMRACEGTGFQDANWSGYVQAALSHGIDRIYHYQYNHPELNSAQAEVDYLMNIVRSSLRSQDNLMMDMEQVVPQADCTWLQTWLSLASRGSGKPVVFYSYLDYIQTRLSGCRGLQSYPLALAAYTPSLPTIPAPWSSALWWQYSSKGSVPGIPGLVDVNKFLEEEASMMPTNGPQYTVTCGQQGVPCSGNQLVADTGYSWQEICSINPGLSQYDPSGAYLCGPGSYGVQIKLPGYQQTTTIASKPTMVVESDSLVCICL